MSTSAGRRPGSATKRAYVPATALAVSLKFTKTMMQVTLGDGRVLGVPLVWFPVLHAAKPKERMHYEIGGGGISLHWPDLDEDLSIAGLMAGVDRDSA
jgi:hypothetical protein